MKNIIIALILAIAMPLSQVGCSSTAQTQLVAKLAVQYAVYKVASNNPAKATRIVAIAREVSTLAGSDKASTVDLLVVLIRSKVDFSKLDVADVMLVNTLIDAISIELKERVGDGPLLPEKILVVKQVADWVIEAAGAAVVSPSLGK